jgi:hypothetical protein
LVKLTSVLDEGLLVGLLDIEAPNCEFILFLEECPVFCRFPTDDTLVVVITLVTNETMEEQTLAIVVKGWLRTSVAVPWNGRFDAETASTAEELASISLNPELREGIGGIEIVLGTAEESASDFVGVDDVG